MLRITILNVWVFALTIQYRFESCPDYGEMVISHMASSPLSWRTYLTDGKTSNFYPNFITNNVRNYPHFMSQFYINM